MDFKQEAAELLARVRGDNPDQVALLLIEKALVDAYIEGAVTIGAEAIARIAATIGRCAP